jgi:thioredoxin 1
MYKLTKFTATWCAPCRALNPILNKVLADYPEVQYEEVDIDKDQALAQEAGIRAVPTMVLSKDGVEVSRKLGSVPAPVLREFMEVTKK